MSGFWLLRLWDLFWEAWSTRDLWCPHDKEREKHLLSGNFQADEAGFKLHLLWEGATYPSQSYQSDANSNTVIS